MSVSHKVCLAFWEPAPLVNSYSLRMSLVLRLDSQLLMARLFLLHLNHFYFKISVLLMELINLFPTQHFIFPLIQEVPPVLYLL